MLGFESLFKANTVSSTQVKKGTQAGPSGNETINATSQKSAGNHYKPKEEEEYERQLQCKNIWLQHMCLAEDMCSEFEGIEVRPIAGLEGVDYLSKYVVIFRMMPTN